MIVSACLVFSVDATRQVMPLLWILKIAARAPLPGVPVLYCLGTGTQGLAQQLETRKDFPVPCSKVVPHT